MARLPQPERHGVCGGLLLAKVRAIGAAGGSQPWPRPRVTQPGEEPGMGYPYWAVCRARRKFANRMDPLASWSKDPAVTADTNAVK